MWTTTDGYRLRPTAMGVGMLSAQLRQPGLWTLVRRNYRSSIAAATAQTVGQLARTARRVGTVRHVPTGARYLVFQTKLDNAVIYLTAQPVPGGEHAVIAILGRPAPALDRPAATGLPAGAPADGTAGLRPAQRARTRRAVRAGADVSRPAAAAASGEQRTGLPASSVSPEPAVSPSVLPPAPEGAAPAQPAPPATDADHAPVRRRHVRAGRRVAQPTAGGQH